MTPTDLDVIVLAGGLGTRSWSYLGDTPKLLAPIAGKPLVDRLLAYLLHQRIRRVVFSLGFGHEVIIDHLRGRYCHARSCLEVLWSVDEADPPRGQLYGLNEALSLTHTLTRCWSSTAIPC
jgi:NDP-sugar pyrophosphorylase family protein